MTIKELVSHTEKLTHYIIEHFSSPLPFFIFLLKEVIENTWW